MADLFPASVAVTVADIFNQRLPSVPGDDHLRIAGGELVGECGHADDAALHGARTRPDFISLLLEDPRIAVVEPSGEHLVLPATPRRKTSVHPVVEGIYQKRF